MADADLAVATEEQFWDGQFEPFASIYEILQLLQTQFRSHARAADLTFSLQNCGKLCVCHASPTKASTTLCGPGYT